MAISVSGSGGVQGIQNSAGASADASILFQVNPELPQIIKDNPAVGKLIDTLAKNNAIAQPQKGDVKTQVSFGMWTHSARSGGMSQEPFKETIVVWQPGNANSPFGRGQVIGIFRLDQLAFSSAAEAQQFDNRYQVKQIAPGKFAHVSDDNGWQWKFLKVNAYGPAGAAFDANFWIGPLKADGTPQGGGWPGGWGGRTARGVFGKDVQTPKP